MRIAEDSGTLRHSPTGGLGEHILSAWDGGTVEASGGVLCTGG